MASAVAAWSRTPCTATASTTAAQPTSSRTNVRAAVVKIRRAVQKGMRKDTKACPSGSGLGEQLLEQRQGSHGRLPHITIGGLVVHRVGEASSRGLARRLPEPEHGLTPRLS